MVGRVLWSQTKEEVIEMKSKEIPAIVIMVSLSSLSSGFIFSE